MLLSDITVIILHGQILILYNWRPYLSITTRIEKVKVKQSHYRTRQAQKVTGLSSPQISRQSTHEGSKVVSPTQRLSLKVKLSLNTPGVAQRDPVGLDSQIFMTFGT